MRIEVSDGVKTIKIYVKAGLTALRKYLGEFTAVKILPVPTAKHVAKEFVLFDGIRTKVKAYPLSPDEDCESQIFIDFRRGTLTLTAEGVTETYRIKTETPFDLPDEDFEFPEKWREETEEEIWEVICDIVSEYERHIEKFAESLAALEKHLRALERDPVFRELMNREISKKYLAIDEGGRGVVLELMTIANPEEIAERIAEFLQESIGYMDFARRVIREIDSPTTVVLTDLTPDDLLLGDADADVVYVDVLNRTISVL